MFKKLLVAALLAMIVTAPSSFSSSENKTTIVLTSENTVKMGGEISSESIPEVILAARKLDKKSVFRKPKPIYLFLNTPGGSIQSGLELIEALKGLNRPVQTVTLFAASMGFQLAQNLGDRHVLKNGVLMSHRAQGGFEGYFGGPKPSQIDSRYQFWLKRLEEMDRKTVARTNGKQTLESYQKSYADELWLTGQQSVDGGYADDVVTVSCDESLEGVESHSLEAMGIRITYDIDKCPLNTSPMNIKISLHTTQGDQSLEAFLQHGGMFGEYCLAEKIDSRTCAVDPNLSLKRVEEIKQRFVDQFDPNRMHVVPMVVPSRF